MRLSVIWQFLASLTSLGLGKSYFPQPIISQLLIVMNVVTRMVTTVHAQACVKPVVYHKTPA